MEHRNGSGAEDNRKALEELFSPIERAVIRLVLKGLKNHEIASALELSEPVVKNHLRKIYAKTGCPDRLNLVLFFAEHGVLPARKGKQSLLASEESAESV